VDIKEEQTFSSASNEDLKKATNDSILKRIPVGAEATTVLVGAVDFLDQPTIAFIRLAEGILMPSITEVRTLHLRGSIVTFHLHAKLTGAIAKRGKWHVTQPGLTEHQASHLLLGGRVNQGRTGLYWWHGFPLGYPSARTSGGPSTDLKGSLKSSLGETGGQKILIA